MRRNCLRLFLRTRDGSDEKNECEDGVTEAKT